MHTEPQEVVKEGMVTAPNGKMTQVGVSEPCAVGKQHRTKFPGGKTKLSGTVLALVHSDVCGTMSTELLGGDQYFLTFIDDKTQYIWVYVLKHKNEVFKKFHEWKAMVEKSTGQRLKILTTDNGGEYTSTEFSNYLKGEGIHHELTVLKTPQQNRVTERINCTIVETTRCILAKSRLPRKFWVEAVSTATHLRNIKFCFSLFIDIHDWTEAKHDCKPFSAAVESPDAKETYSWLSSA